MVSDRGKRAQVSEQGRRFADGRSFIRVRSITTGMTNELMKASALGNVAQIKSLVAGGVDVETQDDLGWRPIHMAAERAAEKRAGVGYLGADVNAPDSKGTLPVYWAAHVETVKVLVEAGADTEALMTCGRNGYEDHGATARRFRQGKLDAIRELAQCGANVDASTDDDDGNNAVHLTAMNDQVDVDRNWERICQPRLFRLEQVCSSRARTTARCVCERIHAAAAECRARERG
jgi:ankyrin repeat protein